VIIGDFESEMEILFFFLWRIGDLERDKEILSVRRASLWIFVKRMKNSAAVAQKGRKNCCNY
jgi:hypothetical protein